MKKIEQLLALYSQVELLAQKRVDSFIQIAHYDPTFIILTLPGSMPNFKHGIPWTFPDFLLTFFKFSLTLLRHIFLLFNNWSSQNQKYLEFIEIFTILYNFLLYKSLTDFSLTFYLNSLTWQTPVAILWKIQ